MKLIFGLPLALNKGIELINTKYIARMDADDVAKKERLERQLNYMENNPKTDLIGANIIYMDYNSNVLYKRGAIPTKYNQIKKVMKYVNVFNHPTFFGKTEVFKKYKYRNLKYSQDYDLICRLLEDGCIVENIPDYLLEYRLPMKNNDAKIIKQKIIYYCVQEAYAKQKLINTDIENIAKEKLKDVNTEKLVQATNTYDEAINALKQQQKAKFIKNIIKSFCLSQYQRRQIINVIKYKFIQRGS